MALFIFAAMHIAIDARYLQVLSNKEEVNYLQVLFEQLIAGLPEHHFSIIGPEVIAGNYPNVSHIPAAAPVTYIGLRRWYARKLPSLLPADTAVLLCINGGPAKTNVPQLVFVSSLAAISQQPKGLFSVLYKKYWPSQLRMAGSIATITSLQQQAIAGVTGLAENRIVPVGYAVASSYAPADWQRQEWIAEKHTAGKAYFLYTGPFSESHFLLVLKAFSLFKKRQQSNLQLLAAGHFSVDNGLQEKLATYKYRHDVKLYAAPDETMLSEWMAGAYAVIEIAEKEELSFSIATAVQCSVPVIGMQTNTALQNLIASAGLYASPSPESLAEAMKLVYKDENLRKQRVIQLHGLAPAVNAEAAATNLWQCIEHATDKNEPTFATV